MAFFTMNPAIFRKTDAPSILVVDKSWEQVLDKPDFFNELAERIVDMTTAANEIGELTGRTTLRGVKEAINEILMKPLTKMTEHESINVERQEGSVLVDAQWDEIIKSDEMWEKLKPAIEKAYEMKKRIEEASPLTNKTTLQQTKDVLNTAVIKPLTGVIVED